jgi:transcriptional regulator with XRE-family HTH domain
VRKVGIKSKRTQTGHTQESVAKELNVDRSTVAKWESGEAMPRADKLPALAKLFGCSIDDLFSADQKGA